MQFENITLKSLEKFKLIMKTLVIQVVIFCLILFTMWGMQALYAAFDKTVFTKPFSVAATENMTEIEKGKLVADAITNQIRYELDSPLGWTANDFLFNKYLIDNRAYRQFGVYHATKVLVDFYSMNLAKLGSNDRESDFLYKARLNNLSINPSKFIFPSAEGSYSKALELIDEYKLSLDEGKGVFNVRTDDLHAAFKLVVGENMLGYALGLLNDSQNIPFYTLDNRIYEVQGIALVVRDFINALYELYPEIKDKNNASNMNEALEYLNKICVYDPLYITAKVNSGELIISYLMFAKNRLEDVMLSIRV